MFFLDNHSLKVVVITVRTTTFVSRIWNKGYHGSAGASIWFCKIYRGKVAEVRLSTNSENQMSFSHSASPVVRDSSSTPSLRRLATYHSAPLLLCTPARAVSSSSTAKSETLRLSPSCGSVPSSRRKQPYRCSIAAGSSTMKIMLSQSCLLYTSPSPRDCS